MTRERAFYIAYRVCNFIYERDFQPQFENHEVCMYIADMANDLMSAAKEQDTDFVQCYYNRLNEEIEQLADTDWIDEAKELLELLDEWKEG